MYFLGIDGGGTKTEFLLTDGDLKEIKRIRKPASNPTGVGIETTLRVLGEGLTEIVGDIPKKNVVLFAGIAGILRGNFREIICDFLGKYGFCAYDAGTDCLNAYKAAFPSGNGICVIMGTGTSVFYKLNGKLKILGGLGCLFDRFGSGYDIGAMGLRASMLFEQGAGPNTAIREKILEKTGKDTLLPNLPEFQTCERGVIASLAECVFDAMDEGDKIAENIVRENMERLAETVCFAVSDIRKDNVNENVKVALTGGLSKNKKVAETFKTFLPDGTDVFVSTRENAVGAAMLSKELIK